MARSGTSLSFVILISKVTIAPRGGRGPVGQVIPGLVRKSLAAGLGVGLDGRLILILHQWVTISFPSWEKGVREAGGGEGDHRLCSISLMADWGTNSFTRNLFLRPEP